MSLLDRIEGMFRDPFVRQDFRDMYGDLVHIDKITRDLRHRSAGETDDIEELVDIAFRKYDSVDILDALLTLAPEDLHEIDTSGMTILYLMAYTKNHPKSKELTEYADKEMDINVEVFEKARVSSWLKHRKLEFWRIMLTYDFLMEEISPEKIGHMIEGVPEKISSKYTMEPVATDSPARAGTITKFPYRFLKTNEAIHLDSPFGFFLVYHKNGDEIPQAAYGTDAEDKETLRIVQVQGLYKMPNFDWVGVGIDYLKEWAKNNGYRYLEIQSGIDNEWVHTEYKDESEPQHTDLEPWDEWDDDTFYELHLQPTPETPKSEKKYHMEVEQAVKRYDYAASRFGFTAVHPETLEAIDVNLEILAGYSREEAEARKNTILWRMDLAA